LRAVRPERIADSVPRGSFIGYSMPVLTGAFPDLFFDLAKK
jgi:hypothetical protein